MTLVAHAGHWLVNIAYALPLIVMLLWMGWNRLQERRGRRSPERIPNEASLDDIMDGKA